MKIDTKKNKKTPSRAIFIKNVNYIADINVIDIFLQNNDIENLSAEEARNIIRNQMRPRRKLKKDKSQAKNKSQDKRVGKILLIIFLCT